MKIKVIDDAEKVRTVREAIRANDGYCPCQLEKNERTKCVCLNFLEGDEEICHCGIYRKVED